MSFISSLYKGVQDIYLSGTFSVNSFGDNSSYLKTDVFSFGRLVRCLPKPSSVYLLLNNDMEIAVTREFVHHTGSSSYGHIMRGRPSYLSKINVYVPSDVSRFDRISPYK